MPTIEENKSVWNGSYAWDDAGEEWSDGWGSASMQWHGSILPRIHAFLPAGTVLEIAPGFGRWTQFLKDHCRKLYLVDLSEKCIGACRERFSDSPHIEYFVNDGSSLDMVPDGSLDFIFSFDSLVHAEDKVISAYVSQIARKLRRDGAAFIHHSNLGKYSGYIGMQRMISKIPKLPGALIHYGILDNVKSQWRARSMTAEKMRTYTEENGLQCITQELITWNTKHVLIDCISTIVRKDSPRIRKNKLFRNPFFMKEAQNISNLSRFYDLKQKKDDEL